MYKMDINNNNHAPVQTMITIFTAIFSWITLVDAQYILSFCLTLAGIVNVMFAIRFYYYAGNEKKKIVKDNP